MNYREFGNKRWIDILICSHVKLETMKVTATFVILVAILVIRTLTVLMSNALTSL